MDPKLTSTDVDFSNKEDKLRVNDFSMLLQFMHDTSSFSDRLVQLAAANAATEPAPAQDHELDSGLTDTSTTEEKKDAKSAAN
ncbi:hypothetical protein ACHAPT_009536 [Fusarium lateritium]